MTKLKYIIVLSILAVNVFAQPIWDSRVMVDAVGLFRDWKQEDIYYFTPGDLKLKSKKDGTPDFQMTLLRYTGTNLTGDKDELRYRNIIQLTIEMEPTTVELLNAIRTKLALPTKVKFIPLPIKNMEAYLLTSTGISADSGIKRLGTMSLAKSTLKGGGVFWTERSFTIAVDNNDAQLIADLIKNNKLALSFSYNFYADMIPGKIADLNIDGDSILIQEIGISNEEKITIDSSLTEMSVKGNAFAISIDLNEYPDAIKKVDINANSIPPAYASLNVYCYDFQENLRPDLFIKTIEVEAVGVGGDVVRAQLKFNRKSPDIYVQNMQFDYAVKMDKPMKYRKIETMRSGEQSTTPWTVLTKWKPMIDISDHAENLGIEDRVLDFEFLQESIKQAKPLEMQIWIKYLFLGEKKKDMISLRYENTETIFKSIQIHSDKNSPVQYMYAYVNNNGLHTGYWHTLTNDYIQLRILNDEK